MRDLFILGGQLRLQADDLRLLVSHQLLNAIYPLK